VVEYRYDEDCALLLVTVSGVLSETDFQEAKFPDVPVGTVELLDMSAVTKVEISSAEVRRLAEIDRSGPTRIKRMAIVATTEVGFGLARMYQTLSDGEAPATEVRVFRDSDAARAWLGLDA
jgi:hypothetical protein